MEIFYNPDIENALFLDEEESKHCIQVLRHKEADSIFVTDGKGKLFECFILDANRKKCRLKIVKLFEEQHRERNIHVAVAPTKQMERMEWMVEKCTELGATSFTFIETERSERRKINTERLQKILVSAMKQSLNYFLPVVKDIVSFKELMETPASPAMEKYICYKDDKNTSTLFEIYQGGNDVIITIGPEGDFTTKEVDLAVSTGYKIALLGAYRLRTETACMAAVQQLMLK